MTTDNLKKIAEELSCGMRAFVHKTSGELLFVPDTVNNPDWETEAWESELEVLENNLNDYLEIERMSSYEAFRMMEDFAEQLTDSRLQNELIRALNRKKPFREFKFVVDNSGKYRQQWFDFKLQREIEAVKWQLRRLENEEEEENEEQ